MSYSPYTAPGFYGPQVIQTVLGYVTGGVFTANQSTAQGAQNVSLPGSDATNNLLRTQPKSAVGSGGRLTADGDAHVGACTLLGLTVAASGTGGGIDISDASGANGTALFSIIVAANTTVFMAYPGVAMGVGVRIDFQGLVGSCTAFVGPAI